MLRSTQASLYGRRATGQRRAEGASYGRYEPLAEPVPSEHVPDPDGAGWWDPSLTPAQVDARIAGLAGVIDAAAHQGASPRWLAAERRVLAMLRRRREEGSR